MEKNKKRGGKDYRFLRFKRMNATPNAAINISIPNPGDPGTTSIDTVALANPSFAAIIV